MITDKTVRVSTSDGEYTLTITSKQIEQTIRRRMEQLVPKARILDMHEVHVEVQPDLMANAKKTKP